MGISISEISPATSSNGMNTDKKAQQITNIKKYNYSNGSVWFMKFAIDDDFTRYVLALQISIPL